MRLLFAGTVLIGLLVYAYSEPEASTLAVNPAATASGVAHIGLNLGSWTSWGAEQLPSSVLKNPGFEGTIDRALVCVRQAGPNWFLDDTDWTARPTGFWDGATFEVLSGTLAGARGKVARNEIRRGLAWFETDGSLPVLSAGDVVSLTRIDDSSLPAQWWFENSARNQVLADLATKRPQSKGVRSLRLSPDSGDPVAAVSYLDAIGDRAGKLLPVNGAWTLKLWARATGAQERLRLVFQRQGSVPFLQASIHPEINWRSYEWTFDAQDSGPPGPLALRLEASGAGGSIWLDDVTLSPGNADNLPFRREVVETLKQLKPGYLRDWQGQLGDTWANRMAGAARRRASRYRPGETEVDYGYPVPEFLQLCRDVGARPWIVMPSTLQSEEWREAGRALSSLRGQYGFDEVVVEFGNENWNPLFRPAGVLSPETLAAITNRASGLFRSGTNGDGHFRFVVGGNAQNPDFLRRFAAVADRSIFPALAPYYLSSYPAGLTPHEATARLFQDGLDGLNAASPDLSLYEMNAHTLGGDTPVADVNALVDSPQAGAALAWHVLSWMNAGVTRQCIYSLAGFDTFRDQNRELVRLFGVTRDLSRAANLRPTGEVIALLNRVLAGELHQLTKNQEGKVKASAFRKSGRWSLALVSSSSGEITLTIEFPRASGRLPSEVRFTDGSVQPLEIRGANLLLRLPPYAVAVAQ